MIIGQAAEVKDLDEKRQGLKPWSTTSSRAGAATPGHRPRRSCVAPCCSGSRSTESSAKVRTGWPADESEDYDFPVWAGVVPFTHRIEAPIDDPALRFSSIPRTTWCTTSAGTRPSPPIAPVSRTVSLHSARCRTRPDQTPGRGVRLMCGVVGLLLRDRSLEPRLGSMLVPMIEALAERGPDSSGIAVYADNDGPEAVGRGRLRSPSAATTRSTGSCAGILLDELRIRSSTCSRFGAGMVVSRRRRARRGPPLIAATLAGGAGPRPPEQACRS